MRTCAALLPLLLFISGSLPALASEECEFRLEISFTSLTLKALEKEVITVEQLVEMAESPVPLNPLAGLTPTEDTANIKKGFEAYATMRPEAWAIERKKLSKLSAVMTARAPRGRG